jgi:hypothetical protein
MTRIIPLNHKHKWEVWADDNVSCVECGWVADLVNPRPGPTLRDQGCTECSKPLDGLPYVTHDNGGGFSGPWCVPCAVQFGFGLPGRNQENLQFYPYDD